LYDQAAHALHLLLLVVLVDRLPVDPQHHVLRLEPLLLDQLLHAGADHAPLQVLGLLVGLLLARGLPIPIKIIPLLVRVVRL